MSWANARFRTGGGPFHIVNAETWRGYPFMWEDWYWSQGGLSEITWHRDFHWFGFVGDLLISAAVFSSSFDGCGTQVLQSMEPGRVFHRLHTRIHLPQH